MGGPTTSKRGVTALFSLFTLRHPRKALLVCTTGVFFAINAVAYGTFAWGQSKEYYVKAAFLYHFVKFVKWPDKDGADTSKRYVSICIKGRDPFGSALKAIEKEYSATLTLRVQKDVSNAAMKTCHILFISTSEEYRLEGILKQIRHSPVLTVSEIDDFVQRGGMIGFLTYDEKVKLEINTHNAAAAHLEIDPMLLEIAMRVI